MLRGLPCPLYVHCTCYFIVELLVLLFHSRTLGSSPVFWRGKGFRVSGFRDLGLRGLGKVEEGGSLKV